MFNVGFQASELCASFATLCCLFFWNIFPCYCLLDCTLFGVCWENTRVRTTNESLINKLGRRLRHFTVASTIMLINLVRLLGFLGLMYIWLGKNVPRAIKDALLFIE